MAAQRLLALGAAAASVASGDVTYPRYGCEKGHDQYPFCDTSLPIEKRVDDLISRLTLDEKPLLMVARESPLGNISRLGVPQYDWGANCVHGVQSRCGTGSKGDTRCPTPFPNPNFLGATFNETVWRGMGAIIGRELRSLWRQGVGEDHPPTQLPPLGLDCWSPNINLVRDPRWGRNLETASEDPYHLGRFGVQITKGLQNGEEDPTRLQAVVTLKHLVANSLEGSWPGPGGPAEYPGTGLCPGGECTRHSIDPNISAYDLASSYFPAFKASVKEGGALGVMCSYNAVNGVPSCANQWLLGQKLRQEWGFQGYVTGDSGAVQDIWQPHYYVPTLEDAAVAAVRAGTDIQSANWPANQPWATGGAYIDTLPGAVRSGKLREEELDAALRRSLTLRFRLGLFDPAEQQPFEHVSPDEVRKPENVAAAVEATEQGLVLLQNRRLKSGRPCLPITSGKVALVGPHGTTRQELLGNYLGQACPDLASGGHEQFFCVQSLQEAFGNLTDVAYAPGLASVTSNDTSLFDDAVAAAKAADYVVLALGLDTNNVEKEGLDRKDITLPAGQLALFDAVRATGKPVVVVLLNGGIVAMSHVKAHADAIVEAWYPGFFGAEAIARAVLGHSNRWGKLPVTIYAESFTDELDMLDFDMTKAPGRTYRYYTGKPLWPFGFGLSYTTFKLALCSTAAETVAQVGGQAAVQVEVKNAGKMAGDEVVMAYFTPLPGTVPAGSRAAQLRQQLFGFQRVSLAAGESTVVTFNVTADDLAVFTDGGDRASYAGRYSVLLSNGVAKVKATVHVDGAGKSQPQILELWAPQFQTSVQQQVFV